MYPAEPIFNMARALIFKDGKDIDLLERCPFALYEKFFEYSMLELSIFWSRRFWATPEEKLVEVEYIEVCAYDEEGSNEVVYVGICDDDKNISVYWYTPDGVWVENFLELTKDVQVEKA